MNHPHVPHQGHQQPYTTQQFSAPQQFARPYAPGQQYPAPHGQAYAAPTPVIHRQERHYFRNAVLFGLFVVPFVFGIVRSFWDAIFNYLRLFGVL